MLAPLVMSRQYEAISPRTVKSIEKSEDSIIIVLSEDDSFKAIKVGMVKSAITRIRPITFIAITIVKEDSMSMRV